MEPINKAAVQPVNSNVASRGEPARSKRRNDAQFDWRLTDEHRLPIEQEEFDASRERPAAQHYLTDATWARERTLEELKTLVRAVQSGVTDPWQLTDLIFYARHPEMVGAPLTKENQASLDEWNAISALLVHPTLNEVGDLLGANIVAGEMRGVDEIQSAVRRVSHASANADGPPAVGKFDEVIVRAVEWCPGLSPAILKGLLAQESNFNTTVINQYGYAGIAQFGRDAAREVGLHVGIAGSASDERLDPYKAIPGAARLLRLKAQRLSEIAFSRYGQPNGVEFWKFVLAAYNGGEGTVALAMGHAYRAGMSEARHQGLVGNEAVSYARHFASKWENLIAGGTHSPLGLAAARYFPTLAPTKYHEIGSYPTKIVARVMGAKA